MPWIKHAFRAVILVPLLISFILPVYATLDHISCGDKETDGEFFEGGIGSIGVDCRIEYPPTIRVDSLDFVWGMHSATGRLNKEFTTTTAGIYQILVAGDATGMLSIAAPPQIPYVAGGSATLEIFARVYEKEGGNAGIMPPGGDEVSIYPFDPLTKENWGNDHYTNKPFQHRFNVELKANTKYIIELKAKSSTSASGAQAAVSNWGLSCGLPASPIPSTCSDPIEGEGIRWLICDITPPETATQEKQEVIFPDPNLESAIRTAINKYEGSIYASDLDGLTRFNAGLRDIKEITGLEYCANLQELYINGNWITSISPLAGLTNLKRLELVSNRIVDVSPLSRLTNLQTLQLAGNQISDVLPLSALTNLHYLSLDNNQISDVSPLSALMNLRYLSLSNNKISDVSPLATLTSLTSLYLNSNQISDVSSLATLTNLKGLDLDDNRL